MSEKIMFNEEYNENLSNSTFPTIESVGEQIEIEKKEDKKKTKYQRKTPKSKKKPPKRAKQQTKTKSINDVWLHAQKKRQILFLIFSITFLAIFYFSNIYTRAIAVLYNDRIIGYASSQAEIRRARENIEEMFSEALGEPYEIENLRYTRVYVERRKVRQMNIEKAFFYKLGVVREAYSLYINGERVCASPVSGALEEILEQIRLSVVDEETISVDFLEKIETQKELVPVDFLMESGDILRMLRGTKTAETSYIVQPEDSWLKIATEHNLTPEELLKLNPGYQIRLLTIGDVLTIEPPTPYLTINLVRRERYIEELPYTVEYINTSALYEGDYQIVTPGEYGAADVVARATYVNGKETERVILASTIVKDPVNERCLRGVGTRTRTNSLPSGTPTRTFRWPVTGRLSSLFGRRTSPGGIGSTNHRGIDIAVPYGTPIRASDGGRVIYAGWNGGYGYFVQIDHGNGYVTCYAHNSAILVQVGDYVSQGQVISLAGSTGNSTGNHCHFEVRYNGVAQNPLAYLS